VTQPAELFSTKSDYAYAKVRELILSGELPPGAVINQENLARTIGISTTPLREALKRLQQRGMVELGAHRDATVTTLSAEEARDLLEVRRALDPLAVALAAERRTKADIALMRAALDGPTTLPGNANFNMLVAHRRLHTAIYQASHNELLIETLDGCWDKADRYRMYGLQVERSDEERAQKDYEHRLLVELVVAGDGATAAEVMREHIDTSLGAKSVWRLMKPAEVSPAP
jgi:DNA-binding GntR family transcriptional regulator